MATVILPVIAASAVEGASVAVTAFVTTVASAAGAMLDQQIIMPALFPTDTPKQTGERLGEMDLQSASEGSVVKRCYGPECRTKGTIIWMTDIRERKHTEEVDGGGKGGGSDDVEVTTYTYDLDVAIAISGRELTSLLMVKGDSKKLYKGFNEGNGQNVRIRGPSTKIRCEAKTRVEWGFKAQIVNYQLYGHTATKTITKTAKLIADADGPDLSEFKVGENVTVAGFSNSDNNGTFKVRKVKTKSNGKTVCEVFNEDRADEAKGDSVTLTQTVPLKTKRCKEITFYTGSETQDPDPLIESKEGVGSVPAFRGTAYVVIKKLQLDPFGRRVPQFSFEVEGDSSIAVGDVIEDLLQETGLSSSQVDASACTDTVRGFVSSGPRSGLSQVRPLLTAFDLAAREVSEVLTFVPRTSLPEMTVDPDDLAAHDPGAAVPRPLLIRDGPEFDLPVEVNVTFLDADNDYQTGNQRVRMLGGPLSGKGGVQTVALPLSMTPTEALAVAARMLWVPRSARRVAVLQLPLSYLHVVETDILSVQAFGQTLKILVTKIDRGAVNGLLVIEGPIIDADAFVQSHVSGPSVTTNGDATSEDIYLPSGLLFDLVDLAPFAGAHVDQLGFYWACCAEDQTAKWAGGVVFVSHDGGTNWLTMSAVSIEATMGETVGELGEGPVGYWDRKNTVQVELHNGELSSKTEDEVLAGGNWAVLGNEVIAFQNATLVDDDTYELSVLLRGLRDTTGWTGQHDAGDRFVLMTSTGVQFRGIASKDLGVEKTYRAVPTGGDVDDADGHTYRLMGHTCRPFAPAHIAGSRDGSNNLTISWVPRTREPWSVFGVKETPPSLSESYEVDVLDGSTVVRTITVSGSRSASYTAAQQTTDGLTPGDPVDVVVYEISEVVGRGNPGEETV